MNDTFKVWIDYKKFGKVMRSEGMKSVCEHKAKEIEKQDPDFSASSYIAKTRAGATVYDNSKELSNKLLKAVR